MSFDYSKIAQIIIHINQNLNMGIGSIEHIGDNVFKIDVSDFGFLSGYGYTGTFCIEDGKVKEIKRENVTMS